MRVAPGEAHGGADQVVDNSREDFTQSGLTYDLIFDAAGKGSLSKCKDSLNPAGVYVSTALTSPLLLNMLFTSATGGKKAKYASPRVTPEDLRYIDDLVAAGKLRSVIDGTFPLRDLAEAHRYAEQGQVRGRVVITVPE